MDEIGREVVRDLYALPDAGRADGRSRQLPRSVLDGRLLVTVDMGVVAVDDITTTPTGKLGQRADWSLTSLTGSRMW